MRWRRMNLPRFVAVGVVALSYGVALAGERLPIDHFTRQPDMWGTRLSPDGSKISYLADVHGQTRMHVYTIETGKTIRVNPGDSPLPQGGRKEVGWVEWVGNERLMVVTMVDDAVFGAVAMDMNGQRVRAISGLEEGVYHLSGMSFAREILYKFFDKDQNVLMLDRRGDRPGLASYRGDVKRVSMLTGASKTVAKNPGEVGAWGVDAKGQVRLGILTHGDLSGAIYREHDGAPWRTLLPLTDRSGSFRPVGFDGPNNRVLVAGLTPEKRWTLMPMDLASGEIGEPLLSDPVYDILPQRYVPRFDGLSLCAPVFSRAKDSLLGIRYYTDAPRVKWFDREMGAIQAAVDKALPDTLNILVDMSVDGRKQLWLGFSDQNPGTYLHLDLDKKSLKPVGSRMTWLDPKKMAQTLAVKYAARDGLTIHGFLSVPVGHQPKDLPLVVMPHGGPWVRDVWGYDPLVQLLASRGYAVLQMNYRGSPGYGEELFRAARREIGRKIQDDIEDGTRWAIAAGVADPKRIAIMGASYGGYSALFALGKSADLYRCGISINGVTDWLDLMDRRRNDPDYKSANAYWRREIGDRDDDEELLRDVSPANFADAIKAPVLIVQGKEDRTVPPGQARLMIRALEKAGHAAESLFVPDEGHGFAHPRARLSVYTTLVAFLEKHLGPGVE
jgi:dipeptidyl aminopeptidase/acylaminoacyl peptidase